MPTLKITLTASIPLPKNVKSAAELALLMSGISTGCARNFIEAGADCGHSIRIEEETPPPASPGRPRRARSAPPVTASAPPGNGPSAPGAAVPPATSTSDTPARAAGEPDPTRDGLAPEAGADPGDPPAFLRRSA